MRERVTATAAILALLVACTGSPRSSEGETMPATSPIHGHGEVSFGAPGEPADVDRIVSIRLLDDPRFDPAAIEVAMGASVRFDVTNAGASAHEFVLGDRGYQEEHEMGMTEPMPPDAANAVTVPPGETRSLVWSFTEAGNVLYACHIADHYASGMVGTIWVR